MAYTDAALTMSSLEIAELTGKEHRNVLRDIRIMFEALNLRPLSFEQTVERPNPSGGRPILSLCFNLPKNLTITLVSGYSIALRARIVDRWMELEEVVVIPPPAVPAGLPGFIGPVAAHAQPHSSRRQRACIGHKPEHLSKVHSHIRI